MNEIKVGNLKVGVFSQKRDIIDVMYQRLLANLSTSAVAVNPEKVLSSLTNPDVFKVLEQFDIRYADGIGVVKVLQKKSGLKLNRIPGCELWEALMKEAGVRRTSVFLVGGTPETVKETSEKLISEYATPVVGFQNGFFSDQELVINKIKESKAKIVTVALGSPKQELFIFDCKNAGINAIFMGVGGTYDVYTGKVKRAPEIFCKLGMEWFFRLCRQPSRVLRQVKLGKFVFLALTNKI
ncbi:WecB/TagA/CpsF family glycosyltransferase [Shewanella algae]|uniref:WecB/TagA/CpsF family glycosyltransferase n=1 Tax=Shewanella algae TaxID=38313 RepID=UPI001C57A6B8|nr:WecB/TagA/CpsF family glycosyltransferase [Shewanella algae]